MIRESKESHYDKIVEKLKSRTLSAKDWRKTLKTFILPSVKTSIPPFEVNNGIIIDECDKANILNNFFQSQTFLNEQNAVLPDLPVPASLNSQLNTILCSQLEVESALNTLTIGKASGPNGLSNRILRELSNELSIPFCSLFNQSLRTGTFPAQYKKANVCPVPKKGEMSVVSNYRPISLLNAERKFSSEIVF